MLVSSVLGAVLVAPDASSAASPPSQIVVKDGVTQPVFSFNDAVRDTVRVRSDMDSDGDFEVDRINARIMRPKGTGPDFKVAPIIVASPYWSADSSAARNRARTGADDPADARAPWNYWLSDFFVRRGYAVVEVDIAGTGGSDGCLDVGETFDQRSVAAVVNWLTGRTTASYADGRPAVADWSTGNVGMYGVSYDGTLAIQQASTGIAGLKTIVPIAAISSWYDYTHAQGLRYASRGARWGERFANDWSNARALRACATRYRQLGDDWATKGDDYTSFYAARNYRGTVGQARASVFLVQGTYDDNVKTTQFAPYWEQLVAHNVPRKLYLHRGNHGDPFTFTRDTVVLHRWLDYWLYGIDNGIMREPQVSVEGPDGRNMESPVWPVPEAKPTSLYLGPAANGVSGSLTSAPVAGSQTFTSSDTATQENVSADPGTPQDYRLAYLSPTLTSDHRMSGTARIEVTFTSATTSTPLTALLVEYKNGKWAGTVARGSLDAKNRESLTSGTPLVPGKQTTGTILLEPDDYIFPAGSQIGVILTGNVSNLVARDPDAGQVTVALGASRAILPLAGSPMAGCADTPWNATAIYNTNDVVSHDGHRWQARWWTQNQQPGTTGEWGVWVDLGAC